MYKSAVTYYNYWMLVWFPVSREEYRCVRAFV